MKKSTIAMITKPMVPTFFTTNAFEHYLVLTLFLQKSGQLFVSKSTRLYRLLTITEI